MFTGIIQTTGTVLTSTHKRGVRIVRIRRPASWKLLQGQSVSVDGICSTVVARGRSFFEIEFMPETLKKTTIKDFAKGRVVNLERSMTSRSVFDGHIVQGHIDARATVVQVKNNRGARSISVRLPGSLTSYVVPQGSVSVNGVSLTVASVRGATCTIALVPYTLRHTNLGVLKKGDAVNIEVDIVARYLHKALRDIVAHK